MAALQAAAFPFGQVGLAPGEGLEPSSRGSEPRVLPVRRPWCVQSIRLAPPTGIEPAAFCSTNRHLPSRPRGRERKNERGAWWWCAEEDLHLHSNVATGLQAAGFADARAGARVHHAMWLFGLPCLFGFQGANGTKEKGPGLARSLRNPWGESSMSPHAIAQTCRAGKDWCGSSSRKSTTAQAAVISRHIEVLRLDITAAA